MVEMVSAELTFPLKVSCVAGPNPPMLRTPLLISTITPLNAEVILVPNTSSLLESPTANIPVRPPIAGDALVRRNAPNTDNVENELAPLGSGHSMSLWKEPIPGRTKSYDQFAGGGEGWGE